MGLETVWFCLIGVLWAGYFLLEGFDFGVGMLLPALPRNERERSKMFDSIGPVWDGNEVWLVVAAGATFAAFPAWYATMFSGFYLALLLLLVLLAPLERDHADDQQHEHQQQGEVEAREHRRVPRGERGERRAAGDHEPDLVAVPHRADRA